MEMRKELSDGGTPELSMARWLEGLSHFLKEDWVLQSGSLYDSNNCGIDSLPCPQNKQKQVLRSKLCASLIWYLVMKFTTLRVVICEF